jgi:competence protein ComEC
MPFAANHFFAKAPFIKLLPPLIAGIFIQWYFSMPVLAWYIVAVLTVILLFSFSWLPVYLRYKYLPARTVLIIGLLICTGAILVWHNNILHTPEYYGNQYRPSDTYIATLLETPVEKTNAYKAVARIEALIQNDSIRTTTGNVIIYFKKDSSIHSLQYGSQLLTQENLQPIQNSGNPGAFDYKRYLLFQQTTAQVYITAGKYTLLPTTHTSWLHNQLLTIQAKLLQVIKTNIKSPREAGLAEALLIGYKDDLDKTLLESYANTGVVHVIAVSGMHLGLIYWLLNILFRPLLKTRRTRWLHPVLVIAILWLFTLVTGGAPSILRAAVMFTCLLIGKTWNKQSSVYNSLAMSAFILLCYNPFWLWDVGFQLSYAALLSIVVFYKPIYNLLFIKNKALDYAWQLIAVTLAAQLLTTPFSLYYFHQFPVYFLLTNLIAVPLSSLILVGELCLLLVSPFTLLSQWLGAALEYGILLLNHYIGWIEGLPFTLWEGIQLSVLQVVCLFLIITGLGFWWLHRHKRLFLTGLAALLAFTILRFISFYQTAAQQKIIIYNIPKLKAVDLIQGNQYLFIGDSSLQTPGFAQNFHLKPSRILQRVGQVDTLPTLTGSDGQYIFGNKTIFFLDRAIPPTITAQTLSVDLLVLSQNPKLYVNQLTEKIQTRQVVIDGSVPQWKARRWKQDFDSLHIPCHNVYEQGAFVMNLR